MTRSLTPRNAPALKAPRARCVYSLPSIQKPPVKPRNLALACLQSPAHSTPPAPPTIRSTIQNP